MIGFALRAFLPTLGLAAALTPLARWLALRTNLVAAVRPDRLHRETRPYGGGLAIGAVLLIFGLSLWAVLLGQVGLAEHDLLAPGGVSDPAGKAADLGRLGVGALLFFIIGLIDDRYSLSALPKLALQVVAAGLVVLGFGIKASLWLAAPGAAEAVSILWIVAVVNAYNMFDHADGLAGAVGVVVLLALAAGQMMMGAWFVPGLALMAAGALMGFLFYNLPPAKLFLGDAGTSLVGYFLAALTMLAQYHFADRGTSRAVVLLPLALLAVPLFDAACVVAGRLAGRRNPMVGDATSHLAHRMLSRGVGPRAVVLFAAGAAVVTGVASVLMYRCRGGALVGLWLLVAAALAAMLVARRRRRAEDPS